MDHPQRFEPRATRLGLPVPSRVIALVARVIALVARVIALVATMLRAEVVLSVWQCC